MIKMITGASVLIVVVMIIRCLTKGRISMRLRYALWIMVALRLIIPGSIGSSPFSVMSLQGAMESFVAENIQDGQGQLYDTAENGQTVNDVGYVATYGAEYTAGIEEYMDGLMIGATSGRTMVTTGLATAETVGLGNGSEALGTDSVQNQKMQSPAENGRGRLFYIIIRVWIVGIVAIGGYMAVGQMRFISYLHRTRKEVILSDLPSEWSERLTKHRVHVYTVQGLPGPCMAGSNIYISPELCSRNDELLHVLAHEYSHAVQGDNWWAFIRCMFCIVYWFHPLVWLAAYASKQDSELACDERAIGLLGETERFAYGRTLLELAFDGQSRQPYIGAVLMMNDSGKKVKERVSAIAEAKKKNGVTVGIVGLIAVLTCGCAFTGAIQADAGAVAETEEAQRKEEAAMRAEAEEIEQMENAAIANRLDEIEQEKVQEEQETLQDQLDEINQPMQEIKEEWQQATADEFAALLDSIEDDVLESAVPAESLDTAECAAYLYDGGQSPIEDGGWCRLYQDEEYGIEIYGLYTEMYGCRGMKVMIDGDVNTWDILWHMPVYQSGIEVMMLEQTPEGLPRSFAFKVCTQNTGTSEVWKLYLADRYDTGTIDLYAFDEEECKKQFRDTVGFVLNEDENKVLVTYEKDMTVGIIDISEYAEYTVGKVVWDGSVVGYFMDEDGTIRLSTCIGLKIAETGETLYRGLPIIDCPVEIGTFGDRKFTLGAPSVDENRVNAALK